MPSFRRALAGLAITLAAASVALLGWALLPEHADFDPAPLIAAGQQYDVLIRRDRYGVPHIFGPRDADVAYGLGFAQCEDDFATVQQVVMATRGKLASHEGPEAAPMDFLVHAMGFWKDVEERYEQDLSPRARDIAEAYAAGVNHYAALHPDAVWPGLLPTTGRDLVAGFAFKTPLFYGFQKHVLEIFEPERRRTVSLSGETAFHVVDAARATPLGSNAIAIAPSRSSDRATRLVVNSHQPFTGPVAWYEVRLESGEGWDVAGGVFPGSPIMLHGHNRDLGWANTVNLPDLVDTYVLEVDPENPDRYRFDGEWRDFEIEQVEIEVRLFGRLRWTVTRELLHSVHGPALRRPHGTYALAFAGRGEIRQLEQYYRLNRARDFDEWLDAMRMQALPSINYVYADRWGNIGYFYNAKLPIRAEGYDWQAYLPGDRSETLWKGFLPFDALPHVINPSSGFVASSNHTPFRVTAPPDNPDRDAFSETFGIERLMTNRALRILDLLSADTSISAEELQRYKFDKRYSRDSDVYAAFQELLALDHTADPHLAAAQAVAARWDLSVDLDDREAALVLLTVTPVVTARREGRADAPTIAASFARAVEVLETHHGRLDPPWGDVNRLHRGELDVPVAGGPDALRAIYGGEPDEEGRLTARAGDTLVMFVEWDAEGTLRSDTVHQFGSASIDPSSPHYADQVPLFIAEELKPMPLEAAALAAQLERSYRPGAEREAPRTAGPTR